MASGYTSNYQLNQWAATDKVLREEFNQDNVKIDGALLQEKTERMAADQGEREARQAAVTAVEQAVTELSDGLDQVREGLTEKTTIYQLGTVTMNTGSDSMTVPLTDIDWASWRLVHLILEINVKNDEGYSLYLNGSYQLASLSGREPAHLMLYPWFRPDWKFRGVLFTGGGSFVGHSLLFQNVTNLLLMKSFPDYPLLAGCKVSIFGEK